MYTTYFLRENAYTTHDILTSSGSPGGQKVISSPCLIIKVGFHAAQIMTWGIFGMISDHGIALWAKTDCMSYLSHPSDLELTRISGRFL